MLDGISIRTRIAGAFAAVLLALLAALGCFTYKFVSGQLNDSLRTALEVRANDLRTVAIENPLQGRRDPAFSSFDEGFAQVIEADGSLSLDTLSHNRRHASPVLNPDELDPSAASGYFERDIPGLEGTTLLLAERADRRMVIVGASKDDQTEALRILATGLLVGSPLAILISSLAGWAIAGRALRPVAAMRERADEITLSRSGERLPLPTVKDEIHELGQTLNGMLDRIERGLQREREFVADASHELRTPLTNLIAELELAQRPGRNEAELRAAIDSTAEETERLSRLAADLLALARNDGAQLPATTETVPLAPLLRALASRFGARLGGRSLVIDCDPALRITANKGALEQAIGNCVDNALRHGGGEIRVLARRGEVSTRIEIGDHGAGFPPKFVAGAFERFSRPDSGRVAGGHGLGLAIVRAIAESHGGSATIVSDGPGATVRIELPRDDA